MITGGSLIIELLRGGGHILQLVIFATGAMHEYLYPAAWIVRLNFLYKFVTLIFVNGAGNKEHLSHFYDN
jgi:hypothetical protein